MWSAASTVTSDCATRPRAQRRGARIGHCPNHAKLGPDAAPEGTPNEIAAIRHSSGTLHARPGGRPGSSGPAARRNVTAFAGPWLGTQGLARPGVNADPLDPHRVLRRSRDLVAVIATSAISV